MSDRERKDRDGYFLVYRKAENNPALEDDHFDKFHAWLWMIGRANYKPTRIMFNGKMTTLKRGQFITSVRKMASTFSWSNDKVLRFLRLLEENKMIRRKANASRTLITIVNYDVYQLSANTDKDTNEYTDKDTNESQRINNKGGHGQHRSDDRASVPNNDPRYMEIAMGEPDEFIIDRDN